MRSHHSDVRSWSVLHQETKRRVVELSVDAVLVADVNGGEMAQKRREHETIDGRQRTKNDLVLTIAPVVVVNPCVDRCHAPNRGCLLAAHGEDGNEVTQREHVKDGLERVTVDAHGRRDMRRRTLGVLFLLVFIVSSF